MAAFQAASGQTSMAEPPWDFRNRDPPTARRHVQLLTSLNARCFCNFVLACIRRDGYVQFLSDFRTSDASF